MTREVKLRYWVDDVEYELRPHENFNVYNLKLHRTLDYPSVITYDSNGKVASEMYYKNGIMHRENPRLASMVYYITKPPSFFYSVYGLEYGSNSEYRDEYIEFWDYYKETKNESIILTNIHHKNELIKQYCKGTLGLIA